MYSKLFKDLVILANDRSDLMITSKKQTNPYYLGFGNPNSKILIVGQEKAIKSSNELQIRSESLENPKQWNYIIQNKITDIDYNFYSDFYFKNPLHPYDGKPSKGNTWLNYQKLINLIYPKLNAERNNSFLLDSFITEVNHEVSPRQLGNQKNSDRDNVIHHDFYKSFIISILATGNYLKRHEVEEIYNVSFDSDYSEPRKKLVVFKSKVDKRIVINVRQLSNDISTEYLFKIAEIVKSHLS